MDGTGRLTYEAFRLNQPDRLVLDFYGAVARVQDDESAVAQAMDNVMKRHLNKTPRVPTLKPATLNIPEHGRRSKPNADH